MDDHPPSGDYGDRVGVTDPRDTLIQIVLSLTLGIGGFVAFCIVRPRWTTLYSARKKQIGEISPLPELPSTLLGWVPALWSVTEQQILASAGLDAYVFLAFFRMAIKFLAVTLFFGLVLVKPVHDAFPDNDDAFKSNQTTNETSLYSGYMLPTSLNGPFDTSKKRHLFSNFDTSYLWMYLALAHLFTGIAIYLLVTETERIIGIRQEYLGNQSTITDRTIRLSGIPLALRSEDKIKAFIERLQIGKVESVTLCRQWQELDKMLDKRMEVLRKLEEAWTVYLGKRGIVHSMESLPISQPPPPLLQLEDEDDPYRDEPDEDEELLIGTQQNGHVELQVNPKARPTTTIRHGFLGLRSRSVDAIDYYEENLRELDEKVISLREEEFKPTALAFVTLDSVAACQMAAQAVLDPSPMTLIANQSPAPADVVWANTYMPRSKRMLRSWTVTLVISLLSIFWSLLLVPLATALNIESIHKILPRLADALQSHYILKSLVVTQLPTLLSTLLFVAVPYLYDWLANLQGMTSQGDVELSIIDKNFFFVFFNYFIIFTVLGTFSNFYKFFQQFQDSLKDTTRIAYTLARSLTGLQAFYTNLIVLQGVGLFPFRLLEIGSVIMYPIYRMGAKTPRDYAELVQPPVFSYGFYLPQVMLIFIICIVYSILRESWRVLLAGLIYFSFGGFVYKYQLLYAMDHRQHSTGKAWLMIGNRMIIGIILFQITTLGQLALKGAVKRSVGMVPLIVATSWFSYIYSAKYTPLMRFIALRSIERAPPVEEDVDLDPNGWAEEACRRVDDENTASLGTFRNDSTGNSLKFVNPSLVAPLADVWIADKAQRDKIQSSTPRGEPESVVDTVW